jgi:hypothetical protein
MADNRHCRPKDNDKKPEKDNSQRNWMRDDFNQPASGPEKNGRCSQANKQREFTAHRVSEMRGAFRVMRTFCLSRYAREHIESLSAMQSRDHGALM